MPVIQGKVTHPHCLWAVDFKLVWSNEPKDINHRSKGPLACKNSSKHQWSITLDGLQPLMCNIGETESQTTLKPSRPAYQQSSFGRTQLKTDFKKQSRAFPRRSVPSGTTPRPTGLGEACRPHLSAFEDHLHVEAKPADRVAYKWRTGHITDL